MKFTPADIPDLRRTSRAPGNQVYRLSSDELTSGLEVEPLLFASLPKEMILELMRMRKSWGSPSTSTTGLDSRFSAL